MVFDATFVREDILLKPSKWVNRQRHPYPPTSLHAVFLAPNKVKNISNDGNYFINKVMLKC